MKGLCVQGALLLTLLSIAGVSSNKADKERPWGKKSLNDNGPSLSMVEAHEKMRQAKDRTMQDLLRNRRRRKLQASQEDEDSSSRLAKDDDIITIECTETPIFLCKVSADCVDRVLEQQRNVTTAIQARFPQAKVVGSTHKLINALYVNLPNGLKQHKQPLESILGVKRIMPHQIYEPSYEPSLADTLAHTGANAARQQFCTSGKGITVAVLDSGIDYTHTMLGGSGALLDYKRAYKRPKDRDGLFPTDTVIEGRDFVGHSSSGELETDDDPIDNPGGHGTLVASTILGVAPDAKLVAVRVCLRMCPEMAIIQGLEYALDPNQDGVLDDKVDIINISLGTFLLAAYDSAQSVAVQNAFAQGVLVVIAAGNHRNHPYILGPLASSPNGLAVGATGHPGNNPGLRETMEFYSSRGPGENNAIKPDMSAPSGSSAALSGTGTQTAAVRGTSFSAPVVSGAAALLKERCPSCSPFAIKSLLMNNAYRNITYGEQQLNETAPVTIVGNGEVRIQKSLDADFWAYSPDDGDLQPSISLGLVNAASDMTIRRTIKVMSLTDNQSETLTIRTAFRDPADAASGAVTINVDQTSVVLGGCNQEVTISIEFNVDANKAPNNYMGVGGDGTVPEFLALDKNEFDGHVMISSTTSGKEIALPFHLILRKAAKTTLSTTTLPWELGLPSSTVVQVTNSGAGTAQLEAFDLLAISGDRGEGGQGETPQGDIRSIGFRTLEVGQPGCTKVLEFLFNTWERHDRLNTHQSIVALNTDGIDGRDYFVMNSLGKRNDIEVRKNSIKADPMCTGFPPDSTYNSRNTLIRVCWEDIGSPTQFDATFAVRIAPASLSEADAVTAPGVQVGKQTFSAPSFDIKPGQTLQLPVTGSGSMNRANLPPLGLQLITNGYRSAGNTGAATPETETHLLLVNPTFARPEETPDTDKEFPAAQDTNGPECMWEAGACDVPTASPTRSSAPTLSPVPSANPTQVAPTISPEPTEAPSSRPTMSPSCRPNVVPRHPVSTWGPTFPPSDPPSAGPSVTPYPTVSDAPTATPSAPPTIDPTSALLDLPTLDTELNGSGDPGIDLPTSSSTAAMDAWTISKVILSFTALVLIDL